MARGVNKVILIGNLGNEPEMRYTATGSAIATLSIATTDTWRDKASGNVQDRTEWHRVVFFTRLAEIAGEYLHKGSKVYIEGSLRTRKWQDKNGVERYTTEIVGNEMTMLDGRSANVSMSTETIDKPVQPSGQPDLSATPPAGPDQFTDDDIPF